MGLESWLIVLAQIALGGAFLVAGVRNLLGFKVLTPIMAQLGAPLPQVALGIGIALQVVCGAALAAGVYPAWAAAGLAVFVVVATAIFHRFWEHQGPERVEHVNGFISNVALVGGFLLAIAVSL